MPSFSAELMQRAALSPRVVGLTFVASQPFKRLAGQYVVLSAGSGPTHAFSIASPFEPNAPGRFEIAAARATTAQALLELPLGSVLDATGPGGNLVWQGNAPALLIATGTGISPLRALIKEELARATDSPLLLLFGSRDSSEELWGDELRELSQKHARFRFWPTHSQPLPGYTGSEGHVQAHLAGAAQALGPELRAYVCGHTPMVRDCTAALVAQGVLPEHIHGESY